MHILDKESIDQRQVYVNHKIWNGWRELYSNNGF